MIKILSKVRYTHICEKCGSVISYEYNDTDYIETGYKEGIYGIRCPVCLNPLNRDEAVREDIMQPDE